PQGRSTAHDARPGSTDPFHLASELPVVSEDEVPHGFVVYNACAADATVAGLANITYDPLMACGLRSRRRSMLVCGAAVVAFAGMVGGVLAHRRAGERSPEPESPRLTWAVPRAGTEPFFSHEWTREEGIPVYTGWSVDAEKLVLGPWPRLGARGAYVRLHGQEGLVNAYVLEIAPGGRTLPEHHVFDEYLFVLRGHGHTRVWQDGKPPAEIPWGPNTLLSPPLNAWHEHVNLGDEPALLVGITNAPPILDFYRSPSFVFDNHARFGDRWDGSADFFARVPRAPGSVAPGRVTGLLEVNLVPDVLALLPLMSRWEDKRGWFATLSMCGNTLDPHVSAWAPESYQAPHRHGPGSTLLIVQGQGFALMWPESAGPRPWKDGHADAVVRTDLRRGMIYSPPDDWYHTHVNTGSTEAVYLALTPRGRELRVQAFPGPGNNPEVERVEDAVHEDRPLLITPSEEDPMLQQLLREGVERARNGQSGAYPK
ncbi:MAG: cupin domain-containing protein, partial [Polyangiaceae bacterium]